MSAPGALPILHAHGDKYAHTPNDTNRTIKHLQVITICWMLVECSVALTASWRAHSPALLAFGSDSSVELLSAIVVLLQFTSVLKVSTERAAPRGGTAVSAGRHDRHDLRERDRSQNRTGHKQTRHWLDHCCAYDHACIEPCEAQEGELDWEPRLGGRRRSIGHLRLSCRIDASGAPFECDPAYPLGRSACRTHCHSHHRHRGSARTSRRSVRLLLVA
jgi:hypothetical protein